MNIEWAQIDPDIIRKNEKIYFDKLREDLKPKPKPKKEEPKVEEDDDLPF